MNEDDVNEAQRAYEKIEYFLKEGQHLAYGYVPHVEMAQLIMFLVKERQEGRVHNE